MGYLLVFVVALVVGIGVFFNSLRLTPVDETHGFADEAAGGGGAGLAAPAPSPSYVPVTSGRHDWQSRMTGVLGLVVSVAVAGIALAISIYAVGAVIGRLFGGVGSSAP